MTGPRIPTMHPHHRRGRHLLPFLAAIALGPLGCTSEQPTEPLSSTQGPVAASTGSHPRPLLDRNLRVSALLSSTQTVKHGASFSLGVAATESTGPSVLILADADVATTNALADTLTDAGFQVTVRPAPEYTWDGTNPALSGFDAVVHLDGASYDWTLDLGAQQALRVFVENGGGYIGAQWNGNEYTPEMADLVLQTVGGSGDAMAQNCAGCQVTYQAVEGQEGHPVLAGLAAGFSFTADGHDAGPAVDFESNPSTVLMRVRAGGPAVLVREVGAGKVVNFSVAPNYPLDEVGDLRVPVTLDDSDIKRLYINSVRWVAGISSGALEPQSISFGPLGDKVYGNPPFSLSASASSGLPVSFTVSGECTVAVSTLTITGAGTCTVTAHQAGNANYAPAPDVSQSFAIAKAWATITVGTEYTFDGTAKSATIITSPAGLTEVTVTYSQNGSPVDAPINAGTYQVLATLDNPNYQASEASGTLTIHQATPVILWNPAPIQVGTPLKAAQLNARAIGVNGANLTGIFEYTPPAGTRLKAGSHSLSVQFTPDDLNYTGASKTVRIEVMLGFSFHSPIKTGALNRVKAGSTVTLKFSVEGTRDSKLLAGEPTSMSVSCSLPESGGQTKESVLASSGAGRKYIYRWKTNPSWAGTCRKLVVTLIDDSRHGAVFQFVR